MNRQFQTGRIARPIIAAAVLVAVSASTALAQQNADISKANRLNRLNDQYVQLKRQGKYKQAAAVATQGLSISKSLLGEENLIFGGWLNNLGASYLELARYP